MATAALLNWEQSGPGSPNRNVLGRGAGPLRRCRRRRTRCHRGPSSWCGRSGRAWSEARRCVRQNSLAGPVGKSLFVLGSGGATCPPAHLPEARPGTHLDEVGRKLGMPVAVVEGQRGREAGHGDAQLHPGAHSAAP